MPKGMATVAAIALVGIVAVTDHVTGFELSFSIFYLLPVGMVAWYVGRSAALSVCVISAVTWLLADLGSGHPYSHPAIGYWNAGVRLAFFVTVAVLLVHLKDALTSHQDLSRQDPLAGILNARAFKQRYAELAPLAMRSDRPISLGYIDLDGFKGINDTHGHTVGDEVLRVVAGELASRLRVSDVVGRLGGDEFAFLLPDTDGEAAASLVSSLRIMLIDTAAVNGWEVGFSIGLAVFQPPPSTADEAITCADELMYGVKRSGKNALAVGHFPSVNVTDLRPPESLEDRATLGQLDQEPRRRSRG